MGTPDIAVSSVRGNDAISNIGLLDARDRREPCLAGRMACRHEAAIGTIRR